MHRVLIPLLFLSFAPAQELERRELSVEGVLREGLVWIPSDAVSNPTPVVFVFHGHGGNMTQAARGFSVHTLWPGAIVIYLQGLNTPGKLTDPEGKKSGWQSGSGDQNDRDLHLVDAVVEALAAKYKIDRKRIFAMGHSNGGAFTYLLWALRGDVFAAVAPMAAALADEGLRMRMKPKPVFHCAGENDPLVKFAWQKMMIDFDRQVNGCGGSGVPTGDDKVLRYDSSNAAPVYTYIHPGKHEMPREALPAIVKFFRVVH